MSPETWARVIEQASRGDPRHLFELLLTENAWPDDDATRQRVLVVLMLGPWQRYREAFLQRLQKREAPFEAGAAELQRMSLHGRRGAAWAGTSGKPAALNDFHRGAARLLYAALRAEYPAVAERDIRERVRTELRLEDVSEATLRKILRGEKTG